MNAPATKRELLIRGKEERAGLRRIWEQGGHLPGREQLDLAQELARIAPVTVERAGRRVRCEPRFKVQAKDRRRLVLALLADGATRGEILAVVPGLSERTFRRIAAESSSEGPNSPPANGFPERRFRPKRDAPVGVIPEDAEPFQIHRMTRDESEALRPDWHRWVYGGQRNPLHDRRRRA